MMEIYQGKIKESVSKLEVMLIETEKLLWNMEQVKNTLKMVNDDLEADQKAKDEYCDQREDEALKYGELKEVI